MVKEQLNIHTAKDDPDPEVWQTIVDIVTEMCQVGMEHADMTSEFVSLEEAVAAALHFLDEDIIVLVVYDGGTPDEEWRFDPGPNLDRVRKHSDHAHLAFPINLN